MSPQRSAGDHGSRPLLALAAVVRPTAGGDNPNRAQHYFQYQVLIKPPRWHPEAFCKRKPARSPSTTSALLKTLESHLGAWGVAVADGWR